MPHGDQPSGSALRVQLEARVGALLRRIQLVILDVDGVLTDGGIYLAADGTELKRFDVKDGFGIAQWRRAGGRVAFLTGRRGTVVEHRARELGVDCVKQGSKDKGTDARGVCSELGVEASRTLVVGDDLPDLAAFGVCGVAVAVADAAEQVRTAAHGVTSARGGHGAVREVLDVLLAAGAPAGASESSGELDGSVA